MDWSEGCSDEDEYRGVVKSLNYVATAAGGKEVKYSAHQKKEDASSAVHSDRLTS